jgi:predicted PurR-regulated permease PerM
VKDEPINHRIFIERLVIAVIVIGIALLLWNLRGLFMLAFGAVLVAVILGIVARPIGERLKLPDWAALVAAVVGNLGNIAVTVGNGIADTLLVIVGGIYLAAQPELYRVGLLKLVPKRGRELAAQALDASGRALKLWLLGRMVSMAVVGLLTWLGLMVIGVPSALALGLLAALLEFVPFIGPILAAVPAILLAFAESPEQAIWTALLFLVIQQFEGNVLEPLVQQRAVDLPPALLLFALVAGGLIFGIVGVILAAPFTVVAFVMVKRLYVQEALHTPTPLPGQDRKKG